MAYKTKTVVNIYGNKYTVSGIESEEYIHKVALYIDKKMSELAGLNNALSKEMLAVLAAVNIVDDYFKFTDELEKERHKSCKEIEQLKSEYLLLEELLFEEYGRLKDEYKRKEDELLKEIKDLI